MFLFIIYIYIYYQQAIAFFSFVNGCALESISETIECVQFTISEISSENMLEYITSLGIIFKVQHYNLLKNFVFCALITNPSLDAHDILISFGSLRSCNLRITSKDIIEEDICTLEK